MKCSGTNKAILSHSIVWAVIMLVTALLSNEEGFIGNTLIFVAIGVAYSHILLAKAHGKTCRGVRPTDQQKP